MSGDIKMQGKIMKPPLYRGVRYRDYIRREMVLIDIGEIYNRRKSYIPHFYYGIGVGNFTYTQPRTKISTDFPYLPTPLP